MPEGEGLTQDALVEILKAATERANAAAIEFAAVMHDIPSSLPVPDGTQRIHNASRALSEARAEMMKAHIRLTEFLGRGIGPDDLNREE